MRCRVLLVVAALSAAALAALPAAAEPPRVGSSFYVVEPDPRMCPSPLCGGYWVRLADRSRTRCSDGVARARCYVARAVDDERHPLERAVTHGAIARAEIETWRFEGLGELGVLVVARVFEPVGGAKPAGRYFRVVDLGIRCVKAPCFSFRAAALNGSVRMTVSGVDLHPARLEAAELARALEELGGSNGLFAQGRVVQTPDGGRELRATRVFLRAPPPRA